MSGGLFAQGFISLAQESAPALLLAFCLAGLVQVLLPHISMGWVRTGKPLGESLRGVAFGLPIPICSCGVVPLYQSLVSQGVPGRQRPWLSSSPRRSSASTLS